MGVVSLVKQELDTLIVCDVFLVIYGQQFNLCIDYLGQ